MKHRDDEGSATIFLVWFAVSAFLLVGLVVDGGLVIDDRGRAADAAEQAARAGADQIDLAALRSTGVPLIDAARACGKAKDLLGSYKDVQEAPNNPCTVSADRTTITIRVQTTVQTTILALVGFGHFTVGAKAVAHPVAG